MTIHPYVTLSEEHVNGLDVLSHEQNKKESGGSKTLPKHTKDSFSQQSHVNNSEFQS